jgi:hypothetical protein
MEPGAGFAGGAAVAQWRYAGAAAKAAAPTATPRGGADMRGIARRRITLENAARCMWWALVCTN